MLRMAGQAGIDDCNACFFKMLCDGQGAPAMLAHTHCKVRQALNHIKCGARVHCRPQQHRSTGMQILELQDKFAAGANRTGDRIAGAVDEFG